MDWVLCPHEAHWVDLFCHLTAMGSVRALRYRVLLVIEFPSAVRDRLSSNARAGRPTPKSHLQIASKMRRALLRKLCNCYQNTSRAPYLLHCLPALLPCARFGSPSHAFIRTYSIRRAGTMLPPLDFNRNLSQWTEHCYDHNGRNAPVVSISLVSQWHPYACA